MKNFTVTPAGLTDLSTMYANANNDAIRILGEECYVAVIVISTDGERSLVYGAADCPDSKYVEAIAKRAARANWQVDTSGKITPIKKCDHDWEPESKENGWQQTCRHCCITR